jgi:3-deoxy-D-manno-octulosonate 8-phosphate phosphatase KdsC-like HAD superfamily phosphatase
MARPPTAAKPRPAFSSLQIDARCIDTIPTRAMDAVQHRTAAGLSIATGNAGDEVKAEADLVTATNGEDGFAQAVEHFILRHLTAGPRLSGPRP